MIMGVRTKVSAADSCPNPKAGGAGQRLAIRTGDGDIRFVSLETAVTNRHALHGAIRSSTFCSQKDDAKLHLRVAKGYLTWRHLSPTSGTGYWLTSPPTQPEREPQPAVVIMSNDCSCALTWVGDVGQGLNDLCGIVYQAVPRCIANGERLALRRQNPIRVLIVSEADHQAERLRDFFRSFARDVIKIVEVNNAFDAINKIESVELVIVRDMIHETFRRRVGASHENSLGLIDLAGGEIPCIGWMPTGSRRSNTLRVQSDMEAAGCAAVYSSLSWSLIQMIMDTLSIPTTTIGE